MTRASVLLALCGSLVGGCDPSFAQQATSEAVYTRGHNPIVDKLRGEAQALVNAGSPFVTGSGFNSEQLGSTIMVSYAAAGAPREPWLTVAQWLALVEKTGKVSQYQGLVWDNDKTLFGMRVKIPSQPSFDVAFKLDFGETFLEEVDGIDGRVPEAEAVLFRLVDFDFTPILRKEFEGSDTASVSSFGQNIQGHFQVAGSGAQCRRDSDGYLSVEGRTATMMDFSCEITKITPSPSNYEAQLRCSGEGSEWDGKIRFSVFAPDKLTYFNTTEDGVGQEYARCQ